MGLRLRSRLLVRVLPSMAGVGVALDHLRRFVRCMRQDCRLIHKTLCVGSVARLLMVRRSVVLLVLQVVAIARLVRRSPYQLRKYHIAVVGDRFAWLLAGAPGVCVVRKCCLFLCLASVGAYLPCLIVRRIRIYSRKLCIVRLPPSQCSC